MHQVQNKGLSVSDVAEAETRGNNISKLVKHMAEWQDLAERRELKPNEFRAGNTT